MVARGCGDWRGISKTVQLKQELARWGPEVLAGVRMGEGRARGLWTDVRGRGSAAGATMRRYEFIVRKRRSHWRDLNRSDSMI